MNYESDLEEASRLVDAVDCVLRNLSSMPILPNHHHRKVHHARRDLETIKERITHARSRAGHEIDKARRGQPVP